MKEATALSRIMAARENERIATVKLTADGPMLGLFTLFGRGIAVDVDAGCTIRTLVCEHLGISEDYLAAGIQTVFLDGWAVDDLDAVVVAPGAVVALSAAMPGLVGATMRRGGHYAVLRGNITLAGTGDSAFPSACGAVLIKLFNQVARDLGMPFLGRGGVGWRGTGSPVSSPRSPPGVSHRSPSTGSRRMPPLLCRRIGRAGR